MTDKDEIKSISIDGVTFPVAPNVKFIGPVNHPRKPPNCDICGGFIFNFKGYSLLDFGGKDFFVCPDCVVKGCHETLIKRVRQARSWKALAKKQRQEIAALRFALGDLSERAKDIKNGKI